MLLAYNERAAQKWPDAKQHAERGLQAVEKMAKPDGVSDADFAKQKGQLSGLLNSVAGFSSLQTKDYASAQKYLRPERMRVIGVGDRAAVEAQLATLKLGPVERRDADGNVLSPAP